MKPTALIVLLILSLAACMRASEPPTPMPEDTPEPVQKAAPLPEPISQTSSIHDAAKDGDLGRVAQLIEADPTLVDAEDELQRQPLHLAARYGHVDTVRHLIIQGAKVDKKAYNRFTPLHLAVTFERTAVIEALLAADADLLAVTSFGATPLHIAADNQKLGLVKVLRDAGAQTDLKAAIFLGESDAVTKLLANAPDSATREGETPLSWASQKGQCAMIPALLEAGADVHTKDSMIGSTALWWAVVHKHKDCARHLLEAGASVDAVIFWKPFGALTPIHGAVVYDDPEMATLLIKHGADPDLKPDDFGSPGRSALELARHLDKPSALLDALKK